MAPTRIFGRQDDPNVSVGNVDPNVTVDPSLGVKDPHDLNQVGFFILFGLIGAGLVLGTIWFFFWAKNGGFEFRENDWDDYKSTVLRRTGPNGTILSSATRPTNLGGGTAYKDYDDTTTVVTESTGLSGITAGASDIYAREKRKRKQERRDREREKRRSERGESRSESRHKHKSREPGIIIDEDAEKAAQEQLRMYRSEKAARVGGMNKSSDASVWDGSTNPTMSVASSEARSAEINSLLPQKEKEKEKGDSSRSKPAKRESIRVTGSNEEASSSSSTPKKRSPREREREREKRDKGDKGAESSNEKSGGIRKVYSTADKLDVRKRERNRAEAKRLQEKGRASRDLTGNGGDGDAGGSSSGPSTELVTTGRRDFSWNESDRMLEAPPPARNSRGGSSWIGSEISEESGTKSYHHPIPELSALRQGYRRGRTDDYEE